MNKKNDRLTSYWLRKETHTQAQVLHKDILVSQNRGEVHLAFLKIYIHFTERKKKSCNYKCCKVNKKRKMEIEWVKGESLISK